MRSLCAVAAILVVSATQWATADESQRYAFLVGVNDYSTHEDDELANLSFCVADMKSFQERLEEIGFKRVYCLTTESTMSWQPTRQQIQKRLQALLSDDEIGSDDFVLVALSGHGLERKGVGSNSTAYFCPTDGHSEQVETLLPVMWFYQQLADSKAGMKLLVVDACRNLVAPRAAGVKPALSTEARGFMKSLSDTAPPRGIAALLSCQSGQFSHEVPDLGHGVFMHHVLEGLSGKADRTAGNRDGMISLAELFSYASDKTEEYVDTKCPVRYSAQTPILRGDLPNYKLVRLESVPGPVMPSEIELSFTVVEDANGAREPVEGVQVRLLYRASAGAPEATVGEVSSGADGTCVISLPGFWSAVQGTFVAVVSRGGQTERYTVDVRDEDRSWLLPLSPIVTTPSAPRVPSMPMTVSEDLPEEYTNSIGMKLKLIPAGEFVMGGPEDEAYVDPESRFRYSLGWDARQHRVRITKLYYLGVHEVTQGQWEQLMGSRPWEGEEYVKEGSDYPATYVSWEDATEFCERLSEKEGREYRLPTEAQWEYAYRAGTTTRYSFGDDLSDLGSYAWFGENAWDVNEKYAHRVGQKRANPWGLYDMHGNVWEWCQDWYDSDYYENSPVNDPAGPTTGSSRVVRGGGWGGFPSQCLAVCRSGSEPDNQDNDNGFRVVQVSAE